MASVSGVRIMFYANKHPPSHFHARHAEHQAVIDIASLRIIEGILPIAKRRKVIAWAAERREQLNAAFVRSTVHGKVEPVP